MPPPQTQTATPLDKAMREARPGFVLNGVFSFFLNLLMLVTPIYMMQVFDRVLSSGRTETLLYLTVIAGFALLVLGALEATRTVVLNRISAWSDRRLSGPLIAASVAAKLGGSHTGSQPLRDLGQMRSFLSGQGINPLFDAPWVPIFVAFIWFLHPWLGMLALGGAVILFILALLNDRLTRGPLRASSQVSVGAYSKADAAIRNADIVQAMGLLPGLMRRWQDDNEKALEGQSIAGERGGLIMGTSKFFRLFVQVGILGLGALLVLRGELTSGGMIAGSILLGRALAPVEQAIGAWRNLINARAAMERLQKLLHAVPERPAGMSLPAPSGHLLAERVSFIPPGSQKPVIKQVSFELEAGETMGLIGPSAAGKSTLCRLLVGTWPPTAGHVRLDGADVHSWDRVDFGRYVGYLPQDVELFSGTVRENIARMNQDADDEDIIKAAREAGVHEMILQLPEGYDTDIGDAGTILSGGQRQRIGLARALFGEPKLLVLDEPNANLDHEGEAALVRAVTRAKERKTTVIMVSHRPSLVNQVDKLLMLRDGAVEMFGEREQIMGRLTAQRQQQTALRPITASG